MKKSNFLKATVFLFALLFAVTGVAYADNTTKFTDIDNSWAKQHIINVYNKGLMGGVSETQFKPGDHVKNYDALVSISRMINREKNINLEQLVKKYQDSVLNKYNVPEYAREGVAICLEKGIVTDFDISAFSKNPIATKNDIFKYLGMAFEVKVDKNAPPVVLAYTDGMYVPTLYKPYVMFLAEKGIINKAVQGEKTYLYPNVAIDRAAFAKMLDLSNTLYEKEKLGLDTGDATVPDTGTDTGADTDSGTGTDTGAGTGTEAEIPKTEDTTAPAVVETGSDADVTAIVDEVIPDYGNIAVFVGTERKVYKVADNAECTIDGVSSGFWRLKKSDMVRLYLENGKAVKIIGESKIGKTVGKLVGVKTGDKTVLTIETLKGDIRNYTITAKTIVIKDGKSALWQELKEGNNVVITTSYDELIEINADGVKSTDKGVIESIVYSRMAPPKIIITTLDGKQNTYYANKEVQVSGAGNDIYSLRPGMQVEASLVDDEISKLAVINETAPVEASLQGTIKSIDTEARLVVVEVKDSSTGKYTDKKVYITANTNIVYVDLITPAIKTLDISSLKTNQSVSVIGTGSADGIVAKTIQLLN